MDALAGRRNRGRRHFWRAGRRASFDFKRLRQQPAGEHRGHCRAVSTDQSHPFLLIDVTDAAGTAQRWRLEMDNRSELVAVGVTANTLKPGDRVVVKGS